MLHGYAVRTKEEKCLNTKNNRCLQGTDTLQALTKRDVDPLAGPVVVAGVIMPLDCDIIEGVNDSKKLSAKKRGFAVRQNFVNGKGSAGSGNFQ